MKVCLFFQFHHLQEAPWKARDWTLLFESLYQLRGLLSFLLCEGDPSMPLFGCPASAQAWDRARTWMQ